jgi:hypothetical protein
MDMKATILFILLLVSYTSPAQNTRIKGSVKDENKQPVIGANVFLEGTYDGASTDTTGYFSFTTSKQGTYNIIVKSLGYTSFQQNVELPGGNRNFEIRLKELPSELNEVVITAGTYQAGDRKRGVQLSSLDVLTTANSNGDFIGALNTLPGTQTVGEDGGLFVRGGDRFESKTFIDGLLVANPYTSKAPDLPTRGRFSPTLFSGTLFSTGGYSAEYGQALSAALILSTNNLTKNNPQSINILPFGFGAVIGKSFDSTSVSLSLSYFNLKPYYSTIPQRVNWYTYPETGSAEFISTSKISSKTYVKVFSSAGKGKSAMELPDYLDPFGSKYFGMKNDNYYINAILTTRMKNADMKTGVSFSFDKESIDFKNATLATKNRNAQVKQVIQWTILRNVTFRNGVEFFLQQYSQVFHQPDSAIRAAMDFSNGLTALFSEAETRLGKKMSVRIGLRGEYTSVNDESTVSPRISAAYKTGEQSQISAAFGFFNQLANDDYLKITRNLKSQRAVHYIANYQYQKNGYLFRIEGYYKDYSRLTRFLETTDYNPANYSSTGYGFAKGIDIFWRDQKSIRNGDYWLSFTLLDAKKKYRDYPSLMYPSYFSRINAAGVYKQYFPKLKIQASVTHQYSSGRPYLAPDGITHYTRDFNNMSANISYLTRVFNKFTVIYFSVSNILGFDQVYGYHFIKSSGSGEDTYTKTPIKPPAKRFAMVGAFISLNDRF